MNKYAPKNISIVDAQKLYDSGFSLRRLMIHYNCSLRTIQKLNLKTRTISNAMTINPSKLTEEGIQTLSRLAKERGLGGYKPHPNKGTRYKGIWFDSKWEVRVAESLDENNIAWERPAIGFIWSDAGKKYYPDFYLPEYNVYLDPKNDYLIKTDSVKIVEAQKRNNIKVIILTKFQLNWETIKTLM
jgi:hypothetical protein